MSFARIRHPGRLRRRHVLEADPSRQLAEAGLANASAVSGVPVSIFAWYVIPIPVHLEPTVRPASGGVRLFRVGHRQSREERGTGGDVIQQHMFAACVRTPAHGTEAVEDGRPSAETKLASLAPPTPASRRSQPELDRHRLYACCDRWEAGVGAMGGRFHPRRPPPDPWVGGREEAVRVDAGRLGGVGMRTSNRSGRVRR